MNLHSPIYLDYNATTPVDPEVFNEMEPFFQIHFANASSKTHFPGRLAADAVELARSRVAELIGATAEEIVFTSGSTESINLALQGVARSYSKKGNHIITWKSEHKAVLDTLAFLEREGYRVTVLEISNDGLPEPDKLEAHITENTILVSMMLANNETGVINPVRKVSAICSKHQCLFFCDATQSPGKMLIDVNDLGVDLLSISAHKMYGPKGTGALFMRRKNPRVTIQPIIYGGGHERGLRSGTLNVPGIAGMGKAAELCMKRYWDDTAVMSKHRTIIEQRVTENGLGFVNGNMKNRLPNTTNICFSGVKASRIISELPQIALSTGSACTSALPQPSHVLMAMGMSSNDAESSIRISTGRFTTIEEAITAADQLVKAVEKLKAQN